MRLALTRAKALQTVSRFPRETRRRYAVPNLIRLLCNGKPGPMGQDSLLWKNILLSVDSVRSYKYIQKVEIPVDSYNLYKKVLLKDLSS